MTMKKMKVCANIPVDIVEQIEKFCEENFITNRTVGLTMLLSKGLAVADEEKKNKK